MIAHSHRLSAIVIAAALVIPAHAGAQSKHNPKHHHYKLIDMGTFGGPASYINPPFNGTPELSGHGVTAGSSATAVSTTSKSNGFVCGGLDGVVPNVFHAFEWQDGAVLDLGALPPNKKNCSVAGSVNADDKIAGTSEINAIDPIFGVKEVRAVLWTDDGIMDLGTFGGTLSIAVGINDAGMVVGGSLNKVPDPVSIFDFQFGGSSNGTQTRAFVWTHGTMRDLGTLGGSDALAEYINRRGQIAGFSYTSDHINKTTGIPTTHPFLWDHNRMTDLGTLGGTLAFSGLNNMAGGMNNRGQVVGESTLSGDQIIHPFLWDGQKIIDLYATSTGGEPLTANAINDAGEVVGAAAFPNESYEAYLWKAGTATDLGHLGDCPGEAWAINSKSQVVGISCPAAFLWENGSIVDLNTLIPPHSSLKLLWPMAINDRGEIAGVGSPAGCHGRDHAAVCGHAFLLIPCDEHHPNVQGCDYSMVDARAVVAQTTPTVRDPSNPTRLPSLMRRMSRYRLIGSSASQRN